MLAHSRSQTRRRVIGQGRTKVPGRFPFDVGCWPLLLHIHTQPSHGSCQPYRLSPSPPENLFAIAGENAASGPPETALTPQHLSALGHTLLLSNLKPRNSLRRCHIGRTALSSEIEVLVGAQARPSRPLPFPDCPGFNLAQISPHFAEVQLSRILRMSSGTGTGRKCSGSTKTHTSLPAAISSREL